MSWPEEMDMLWIKFLSFVSVFCSMSLSCYTIVHILKDKHKVAGNINSLNLLVCSFFFLSNENCNFFLSKISQQQLDLGF